jgi:hypothetical protein
LSKPFADRETFLKGFGFARERSYHRLAWRVEDSIFFECRGAISLPRQMPDLSQVTHVIRRLFLDNESHARFEIGIFASPRQSQLQPKIMRLNEYAKEFWNSPVGVSIGRKTEKPLLCRAVQMLFEKFVQMSSSPGKTCSGLCYLLRPQVQVIASVSKREVPKNAHSVDANEQVHVAFKRIKLEEGPDVITTVYLTYSPEFITDPQGIEFKFLRKIRAVIAWTHSDMEILVHMLQRCVSENTEGSKFAPGLSKFVKSLQRQPEQDDPDRGIVSSVSGLIRAQYANTVLRFVAQLSRAQLDKKETDEIRVILETLFRTDGSLRESGHKTGAKSELLDVSDVRVSSVPRKRDQIFICYSHKDNKYFRELIQHLYFIKNDRLELWSDERIQTGAAWLTDIENALARAKVGVCLVSTGFFDSKFINSVELPRLMTAAKNEGVTIFWVAVEPYNYDFTPFGSIQCANDPQRPLNHFRRKSDRQKELVSITKKLFEIWESRT